MDEGVRRRPKYGTQSPATTRFPKGYAQRIGGWWWTFALQIVLALLLHLLLCGKPDLGSAQEGARSASSAIFTSQTALAWVGSPTALAAPYWGCEGVSHRSADSQSSGGSPFQHGTPLSAISDASIGGKRRRLSSSERSSPTAMIERSMQSPRGWRMAPRSIAWSSSSCWSASWSWQKRCG